MEQLFRDQTFQNKKIQRIAAVNGRDPNISNMLVNYIGSPLQPQISHIEYSCLLSHLETLRTFSESGHSVALILEDDMTLEYKKYWVKRMEEIIREAPADWDIIQLCYITEFPLPTNTDYVANTKVDRPCIYSTGAYLVSNKNLKSIMATLYKNNKYFLENNENHVADEYLFAKLKTYTYRLPYFTYKSENDSTIHAGHIDFHNRSKKMVDDMYRKMYPTID
jgi:GR25 family glycosyltransferase involved in LPS biosynthesis